MRIFQYYFYLILQTVLTSRPFFYEKKLSRRSSLDDFEGAYATRAQEEEKNIFLFRLNGTAYDKLMCNKTWVDERGTTIHEANAKFEVRCEEKGIF